MGGVGREKGVLKLVHPGGIVEVHKNAITAAEVMRRNPRHCITRPDVFKFPWIVVRPESVLCPGKVFFVVPCHTIRRLLQSHGIMTTENLESSSPTIANSCRLMGRDKKQQLPDSEAGLRKQTSPPNIEDSWATEVPSMPRPRLYKSSQDRILYEAHDQYGCQPLIEPTSYHRLVKRQSPRKKTVNNHEHEVDGGRRHVDPNYSLDDQYDSQAKGTDQQVGNEPPKKKYPIEHWPMVVSNYKDHHHQEVRPIGSFMEERERVAFQTKEYANFHGGGVTNLKPCLKRPGTSNPKPRDLRVIFVFPVDDRNRE